MPHWHWDEFQVHASYLVPSVRPIVSVIIYKVGKICSKKADQLAVAAVSTAQDSVLM